MKRTIITMCLLLCCMLTKTFSQDTKSSETKTTTAEEKLPLYNLFYLSKYIASENPTFEQREQIYSALLEIIGKDKIEKLTQDKVITIKFRDDYLDLKKVRVETWLKSLDPNGKTLLNDLKATGIKIDTAMQSLLNRISLVPGNIYANNTTINDMLRFIEDLKSDTEKINEAVKRSSDGVMPDKEIDTRLIKITGDIGSPTVKVDIKDTTCFKDSDFSENSTFTQVTDKYLKLASELIADKDKKILELKKKNEMSQVEYDTDISLLAEKLTAKSPEKVTSVNAFIESIRKESTAPIAQVSVITAAHDAQQSLSYSGLSIPSQSQMIEAMAVFLAKRAKQEAAIWFMDQLRTRMNNPLVYDTFPETIALLETLEDYHTANFGKSWRYAIAQDFVQMPKNLAHSNWIDQMLDDREIEELRTAVDFGYDLHTLIMERYNYRDIIRNLYLSPAYKTDSKSDELKKSLRRSFTLLYIATNELFTLHTVGNENSYRLLSYEELKTLDMRQWNTFIELLGLKYGEEFTDLYKIIEPKPEHKEHTIKWISTLLITLNQFDRINKEQQQLRSENKLENTDQSFGNSWKVLNQVIKSIDIAPYTEATHTSKLAKHIVNVQSVLEVIENIQQKNFLAATQKSLKLIDDYYTGSYDLSSVRLTPKDTEIKIEGQKLVVTYKDDKNMFSVISEPKFLSELSIVSKETDIVVDYKPKGADTLARQLHIDRNNLKLIQQLVILINRMPNKEAVDFIQKATKEYQSDDKKLGSFITRLKAKSSVEIEVLKAVALYANTKDISDGENLQKAIALFTDADIKLKKSQLIASSGTDLADDADKPLYFYKDKIDNYGTQLVKLTSFFGDVLSTTDANQLANVIESHALPPTSYKMKRKLKSSIDLNAYVGAFGGYMGVCGNSTLNCQWTGGITAPIGFTFTSLKFSSAFKGFISGPSIHLQLVDLGNIVNHYLVTPDSAYNKEVHFTEVFSPGVNFLFGIKNTPLVLFAGLNGIPLRTHTDGTIKMNDKLFDAWVFKAGLKIDIPLVNLYSKTRN